jgi:hypothetical protein
MDRNRLFAELIPARPLYPHPRGVLGADLHFAA